MHISSRRDIGGIILAGQFIGILLSQNDIYGHRIGILTITGIGQRFPSSMGNTECSYPGDMSTGLGQSCSWAMPTRSKIDGKKAERAYLKQRIGVQAGEQGCWGVWLALLIRWKTETYYCCGGALLTPYSCWPYLPCFPSRITVRLAAEVTLALRGFCCSKAGSG